ncbi:hypothetical protein, partial [Vibrio sp. 1074]|uniref:hypothetical protein n=1 Tax=Vibrio sp. 1074 TaxID=3074542 RepID=UPI002964033B
LYRFIFMIRSGTLGATSFFVFKLVSCMSKPDDFHAFVELSAVNLVCAYNFKNTRARKNK